MVFGLFGLYPRVNLNVKISLSLFVFSGMEELHSKFQKMLISKGPLLTIKDGVQKIRDSFFMGKLRKLNRDKAL